MMRSTSHSSIASRNARALSTFDPRRKPIRPPLARKIFNRDNFSCAYCGDVAQEIDHVIPVAFGGTNAEENLVASCRFCNAKASDKWFGSIDEKRAYLEQFSGERAKRRRRAIALCGDCGYVFAPGTGGATNILCRDCTHNDDEMRRLLDAR